MQKKLSFVPPVGTPNVPAIGVAEQIQEMAQSLATNRMGTQRPDDIVDGETWHKLNHTTGEIIPHLWRTPDGDGDGTIPEYFSHPHDPAAHKELFDNIRVFPEVDPALTGKPLALVPQEGGGFEWSESVGRTEFAEVSRDAGEALTLVNSEEHLQALTHTRPIRSPELPIVLNSTASWNHGLTKEEAQHLKCVAVLKCVATHNGWTVGESMQWSLTGGLSGATYAVGQQPLVGEATISLTTGSALFFPVKGTGTATYFNAAAGVANVRLVFEGTY